MKAMKKKGPGRPRKNVIEVVAKRGPGRPRKAELKVSAEVVKKEEPSEKTLTKAHMLQMLKLFNTTHDILKSYRFLNHPRIDDIIALGEAHDAFQRGVYIDIFGEKE